MADVDSLFVQLAVQRGIASREAVQEALAERARSGGRLARVLVARARIPTDVARRLHAEAEELARTGGSAAVDATLPPPGPPGTPPAPPPLPDVRSSGELLAATAFGTDPGGGAPPPRAPTLAQAPPPLRSPEDSGPFVAPARGDTPNPAGLSSSGVLRPLAMQSGQRFGRYQLDRELGRGGMGIVWKAQDLELDRPVAIKMLLHGAIADERLRKRFQAEARAVARITHPNVVGVYDVGERDGVLYFVMEFVDGPALNATLKGHRRLELDQALHIAEGVSRALAVAHQHGIVHRDLKPANVLLAPDGTPKLTDFGIAKDLTAQSSTIAGEVLGTPTYMSPEQAEGRTSGVDGRADVYSLGAILFRMVTGRPVFEGPTPYDVMNQVVSHPAPSPRTHVADLPRDLEALILRCLEKDREARFASADELLEALSSLRRADVKLPPRTVRVRAPGRETLVLAGAGGSIVTLLVVLGLVLLWPGRRSGPEVAGPSDATPAPSPTEPAPSPSSSPELTGVDARAEAARQAARALELVAQDPARALALAREAAELAPGSSAAQAALGRLLLDVAEDPAGALAALERALAAEPDRLEARTARARCLAALERPASELEAEAYALEGVGSDPARAAAAELRAELALRQGATSLALERLEDGVRLVPDDARLRLRLARLLFDAGRTVSAEREATRVLGLDDGSVAALFVRAQARQRLSRRDDARADLEQALELDPDHAEARELLARLEREARPRPSPTPEAPDEVHEGSDEEAHQAAHAALRQFELARQRRDGRAASQALRVALQAQNLRCASALLARARACLAVHLYPQALADAERLRELNGESADGLAIQAEVYLNQKRTGEAYDYATRAIEAGPDQPSGYMLRARALEIQGRLDEALRDWDAAVERSPERAHYVHERGHFHHRQGRLEEGLSDIRRAIELTQEPDPHLRLVEAELLAGLDRREEAAEALRALLDDPQTPPRDQQQARAKLAELNENP